MAEHVTAGRIFVDGLGVGDVGNVVLRDRHNLAENGIKYNKPEGGWVRISLNADRKYLSLMTMNKGAEETRSLMCAN